MSSNQGKISRRRVLQGLGAATGLGLVDNYAKAVEKFASRPLPQNLDYIIVGSGAGGGPLAVNLAKAGFRVLVLEAGGAEKNMNIVTPGLHANSTEDKGLMWNYLVNHYKDKDQQKRDTKYVENSLGKGIWYPRAKTLGGCTAHNAMITVYPNRHIFDEIASMSDDSTWSADNMRNYFMRLERNRYIDSAAKARRTGHGKNGWLSTERSKTFSIFAKDSRLIGYLQGVKELNDGPGDAFINKDANSKYAIKIGEEKGYRVPMAVNSGRRSGVREHLLNSLEKYPNNLFIRTHAHVTKVLFEDGTNNAIGVEYVERKPSNSLFTWAGDKVKRRALAKKETILAGGAFNSPQLLMLSGIGPADHLRSMGITPRVDLPGVGENLQDKYEVTVVSELVEDIRLIKECTFGELPDPCLSRYLVDPAGSAYGHNGVLLGFRRKSDPSLPAPDLFIFGIPGDFRGYYPGYSKSIGTHKNRITWAVLRGQNGNRAGTVRLKSKDPFAAPEIDFNYFEEGTPGWKNDLNAMYKGVEFARNVHRGRREVRKEIWPGSKVQGEAALKEHIRNEAWGHHASCSNKLGATRSNGERDDDMAVLDHKFRVNGVNNLRVVDASSFPKMPGLFIATPIYMISEKASDVILQDARKG